MFGQTIFMPWGKRYLNSKDCRPYRLSCAILLPFSLLFCLETEMFREAIIKLDFFFFFSLQSLLDRQLSARREGKALYISLFIISLSDSLTITWGLLTTQAMYMRRGEEGTQPVRCYSQSIKPFNHGLYFHFELGERNIKCAAI